MATMLWRAQGNPAAEQETALYEVSSDEDWLTSGQWREAKEALGIAYNRQRTIQLDAARTRAEIAAFLYRCR